jgi:selenocysteine-specific elongation factor
MRDLVVGTAGHIDHGKTLLVQSLTGINADRFPEEKARGITLDIGFATLSGPEGTLHFVDLPGHERFIKNMLAGATGMDLCLLVVAADESVMPQTVEHAEILDLLGVRRGLVALTKTDLVDAETREMAELELQEFLAAHHLGHLPVFPVSSVTGEGLPALRDALFEAGRGCPAPPPGRPFRLPLDRSFAVKGFGTVVTGTCIDGELSVGDTVSVYPEGRGSKVRGLQVFGSMVERVRAGQRTALNLADIPHADLLRGMLVSLPGCVKPAQLLDVRVRVLPSARAPLKTALLCALHIHTQEVEAHLHLAHHPSLGPGEECLAQLRMAEPVMAWPGDRFILRLPSPARTVAGGEVLMVASRKARWGRPRDRAMADILLGDDPDRGILGLLLEAGPAGTEPAALSSRMGVHRADLEDYAPELERGGALARWAEKRWWLHGSEASAWLERAAEFLKAKLGASPRAWLPRQELAGRWGRALGPERGAALVDALVAAGMAESDGDRVRLAGHRVSLTPEQAAARESALEALAAAAPAPRTGKEMEEAAGPAVRQILPLMAEDGEVVRFSGDHFILPSSLESVRAILARRAARSGPLLPVPEFKDLLGITRKHAMPLLEYLDDLKWTRREAEGRRILLPPEEKG